MYSGTQHFDSSPPEVVLYKRHKPGVSPVADWDSTTFSVIGDWLSQPSRSELDPVPLQTIAHDLGIPYPEVVRQAERCIVEHGLQLYVAMPTQVLVIDRKLVFKLVTYIAAQKSSRAEALSTIGAEPES